MQNLDFPTAGELFRQAAAKLVGREVARDLPGARRLLRQAAQIGSEDAALLEVALTANGSGAPPDWSGALSLLRSAARISAIARSQLELIRRMPIDESGNPLHLVPAQTLARAPDVRLIPSLLTAQECAHVAAAVADLMRPAVVVDPATGRQIAHPVRRSDAAVIGPAREDLVINTINRRIAAASGTTVAQGEPIAVLRYGPGQEYRSHYDALPNEPNQRIATVIIYLSDGYEGGETRFDVLGLQVSGRRGDALVFGNVLPDGRADPDSRHAGLPVTRGQKMVATRWIRREALDVWRTR
jgi:prolyl 4-hydroxylase